MSVIKTRKDKNSPWEEIQTIKGEQGKSAYQIAVKNGYTGTEQEWLKSLEYQHSEEFTNLANQVKSDANNAKQSADNAKQSEQTMINKADKSYVDNNFQPKEGKWEYVDTVVSDTLHISRNYWPDGTPYSFKKIAIKAIFPIADKNDTMIIAVSDDEGELCRTYPSYSNAFITYHLIELAIENGYVKSIITSNKRNDLPLKSYESQPFKQTFVKQGQKITQLNLAWTVVGQTFEIWGVRA